MPEIVEFVDDAEFVPKAREYSSGPRGPRARSEAQQEWDKPFEDAMNGKGYIAVQVKPEDAALAKKRITSAARLNAKAITEGEPRPGRVEGTVILSWKIREPKKRASSEAPE